MNRFNGGKYSSLLYSHQEGGNINIKTTHATSNNNNDNKNMTTIKNGYSTGTNSTTTTTTTPIIASNTTSLCHSNQLLKIKHILFPELHSSTNTNTNTNTNLEPESHLSIQKTKNVAITTGSEYNKYNNNNDDDEDNNNEIGNNSNGNFLDSMNNQEIHLLIHFLAGLLQIDPDLRLTPFEALNHPFLSCIHNLPSSLLSVFVSSNIGAGSMSSTGGRGSSLNVATSKKRNTAILSLKKLRESSVTIATSTNIIHTSKSTTANDTPT